MAATPTRDRTAVRPQAQVVYVWELPVRIVHWVIVLALVVLSITGYELHHPFLSGTGRPGDPGFTIGTMRFIHEATAFVFIAAVLVRVYWAFVGNRYAHWRGLVPTTRARRADLVAMLRYYFLLRREPPRSNGHNPLAGIAYLVLYAMFGLSILTGLGLFAWILGRPPWTSLFGWTYHVMAIQQVRLLHFLMMFVFIAFMVHHVYSVLLFDIEERNGEISSMFTGYKANIAEGEALRDDPSVEQP